MIDDPPIRVARVPGGALTYLVSIAPEALPPVRSGDLTEAWAAAREAASDAQWGTPRLFRFLLGTGERLDLALADDDACCWAAAIDQTAGMHTPYGLSLCLRLLALVDLLARFAWLGAFYRLGRAGAALDPALVRVAASVSLTSQARFDEVNFRTRLAHAAAPGRVHRPAPPLMISGAAS